ncbi:hypothetical protein Snoj_04210 [Streptomyces nojiriensis]|uniref:Uncharacterized protein n=1 Tax=Streptomyces nojiriensis TaxID=66374 RepID=A0ABQ3SED4_9ACTN|nr:hypothetical protein [Streptomyces nojiriensis]QTI48154.1 hypothetical protein JYK04_06014 [Streptomyces nojiriensis]GGS25749.1 hypothetical protein GCM10010205_64680 [Streptomyces nojiriensis]GHI66503.1 hypothetical protein Snoj_04210 [Streptomyces nojiriensis]
MSDFRPDHRMPATPWGTRRAADVHNAAIQAQKEMREQLRFAKTMRERAGNRAHRAVEAVVDSVERRVRFLKIIAEGDPAVNRLLHNIEVEAAWLRRAIEAGGAA